MILIKPSLKDEKNILAMIEEFAANGEEKIFGASKAASYKDDYQGWIKFLSSIETPNERVISKGYVPTIQYVLFDNEIPVGFFCARLSLTPTLLHAGGHIGFSIRPSMRKMGYAAKGLKLLCEEYKKLGVPRVQLCCFDYNTNSAKTIKKCGGVLEKEIMFENKVIQKYWIEIK